MELWQLKQRQSLPLQAKIILTEIRIRQWYEAHEGQVYVSFSGGKDSTVLLHLVRQLYPDVPAVFVDTGLEYPEIRQFVKTVDNVIRIKPKMHFKEVIEKYGYPVISKKVSRSVYDLQNPSDKNKNVRHLYLTGTKKDGTLANSFKLSNCWRYLVDAPFKISNKCCYHIKHKPFEEYEKRTKEKSFVGTMADDGQQRESSYLKTGCNNYRKGASQPMAFWSEQDVWEYLNSYKIPYSTIYNMGEKRTGCMFCMFGVHLEEGSNRFQRMKHTHPKLWEYCIYKLGLGQVLDFINVDYGAQNSLDFTKGGEK